MSGLANWLVALALALALALLNFGLISRSDPTRTATVPITPYPMVLVPAMYEAGTMARQAGSVPGDNNLKSPPLVRPPVKCPS